MAALEKAQTHLSNAEHLYLPETGALELYRKTCGHLAHRTADIAKCAQEMGAPAGESQPQEPEPARAGA